MISNRITAIDIDILGELGNIGSGNAATALSQMLNQPVLLDLPSVQCCNITNIQDCLGNPEELKTCISLGVQGLLNGYIVLLFTNKDVKAISDTLIGGHMDIDPNLVLSEVSNIISGAYIGALANMLNGRLELSPPELAQDMLGSLIDNFASMLFSAADETIIINTKLTINSQTVSLYYLLLLEQESLNKMLNYFKEERL